MTNFNAKIETQDPVMKAAQRAAELYRLHERLETEEFRLKQTAKSMAGITQPDRDRLHLIQNSTGHIWDEVTSLWKEVAHTDTTTLPGVFAQVMQAWYLASENADPDYAVEVRQMDRLFMSIVRYLSAETGLDPEDVGAKGFALDTTLTLIKQGYKAA